MNVLVTGGAGFIGSHLVEKLLARGDRVAVLDDFNDFYDPNRKLANLAPSRNAILLHRVSLADADAVERAVAGGIRAAPFDAIVHLAARAGVRPSIAHPRLYVETNVSGTLNLLEAARRAGTGRLVFGSSSSVYGLCKESPFREDMALRETISPYAATKLAGEQLCSNYAHLHGITTVALRFFTVYGPRQRPDLAIHQFTERIAAGRAIRQFGDGSTRRDYTYVDDIVAGILAALSYEGPVYDVFNLGGGETIALSDLIARLEEKLEVKAKVERLPEQPGDLPMTSADVAKADRLLGWQPKVHIDEGLRRFVEWFQDWQASNTLS